MVSRTTCQVETESSCLTSLLVCTDPVVTGLVMVLSVADNSPDLTVIGKHFYTVDNLRWQVSGKNQKQERSRN